LLLSGTSALEHFSGGVARQHLDEAHLFGLLVARQPDQLLGERQNIVDTIAQTGWL